MSGATQKRGEIATIVRQLHAKGLTTLDISKESGLPIVTVLRNLAANGLTENLRPVTRRKSQPDRGAKIPAGRQQCRRCEVLVVEGENLCQGCEKEMTR